MCVADRIASPAASNRMLPGAPERVVAVTSKPVACRATAVPL
jgi:hypothetical protein